MNHFRSKEKLIQVTVSDLAGQFFFSLSTPILKKYQGSLWAHSAEPFKSLV